MKNKSIPIIFAVINLMVLAAQAQFATIGGGLLVSERPLQPVAELNAQTAPFFESRAYLTLSWTDQSVKPTVITALERSVFKVDGTFSTGVGAGFLWLEPNNYKPEFMLVSSTVVPLPLPRASFVMIGSALPFQDFDWSLVLKVGWAIWFLE